MRNWNKYEKTYFASFYYFFLFFFCEIRNCCCCGFLEFREIFSERNFVYWTCSGHFTFIKKCSSIDIFLFDSRKQVVVIDFFFLEKANVTCNIWDETYGMLHTTNNLQLHSETTQFRDSTHLYSKSTLIKYSTLIFKSSSRI